jgi:hypothetical protein
MEPEFGVPTNALWQVAVTAFQRPPLPR